MGSEFARVCLHVVCTRSPSCNDYDRLAERILRESVVPFLGAGFRYGARDGKGSRHGLGVMPAALIDWLECYLAVVP